MGRYMGIAPRANLVSVKVSDDDGNTTVLDVINGLQFAVDNKDELGIRVVNLSLSSTVAESYRTDPLDAAVERPGSAASWSWRPPATRAPPRTRSRLRRATTRGRSLPARSTTAEHPDSTDDVLAPWSSRGVTQDGVRSPRCSRRQPAWWRRSPRGSDFQALCRRCVVGRSYFRPSGTSMSTAVVSGVAALVLEANPS